MKPVSMHISLASFGLSGALVIACNKPDPGGGSSDAHEGSTALDISVSSAPTTGDTGAGSPGSTGSTGSSGSNDPGSTHDASTSEMTTGAARCEPIACDGFLYDCGDCEDNDGDGRVDLLDPECISPCDALEDRFPAQLEGDSKDPCKQDCFFDVQTGDDACSWNLACDPKNPGGLECPHEPDKVCAPQLPACAVDCAVPNGCDCFGCCTLVVAGLDRDVYLGDEDCSFADLAACRQCSKNPDCADACEPEACEVCFGGGLPPGCAAPGCDGAQPCLLDEVGDSGCPAGTFCQTGCCAPIPRW